MRFSKLIICVLLQLSTTVALQAFVDNGDSLAVIESLMAEEFQELEVNRVPTGLLYDKAYTPVDYRKFNGTISAAHLQGKHTTSLYEMYPLGSGGYVIDSPGIRGFGLVDVEKEEIAKYFPEMLRASADCRFTPCTHTHEPGCAVKAAVDEGLISPERYNSYLGMLEEDKKFR